MTFTKGSSVPWSKLPIGIEASAPTELQLLKQLASTVGAKSFHLPDDKRVVLHTAAVFANNFTNHILGIAFRIMQSSDLPKELIYPLITETFQNALAHDPTTIQTGPAIRNDLETMHAHLNFLHGQSEWQDLYVLISNMIAEKDKA